MRNMETGWYWYKSDEPNDPASSGDWVVIWFHKSSNSVAVADESLSLDELKGRFVGPIQPPAKDLEEDRKTA